MRRKWEMANLAFSKNFFFSFTFFFVKYVRFPSCRVHPHLQSTARNFMLDDWFILLLLCVCFIFKHFCMKPTCDQDVRVSIYVCVTGFSEVFEVLFSLSKHCRVSFLMQVASVSFQIPDKQHVLIRQNPDSDDNVRAETKESGGRERHCTLGRRVTRCAA